MSNPALILNQPQVQSGLVTATYTATIAGIYNAKVQVTVPESLISGSGSGSGQGLGAGTGGGGTGFTQGDQGTGKGGFGYGFGAGNNYQQPPAAGSNQTTSGSAVSSALVITVNQNGSPIFTNPVFGQTQSAQQFLYSPIVAATGDNFTVVLSSANASDAVLNGVVSTITFSQGLT